MYFRSIVVQGSRSVHYSSTLRKGLETDTQELTSEMDQGKSYTSHLKTNIHEKEDKYVVKKVVSLCLRENVLRQNRK